MAFSLFSHLQENSMACSVHRIGKCLNVQARKQIIHAFVMPHVKFCITVWGNAGTGCATSFNYSLQKINRVILRNKSATIEKSSHKITGIVSFDHLLPLSNVCRQHSIISNNSLEFYTSANFLSNSSVYSTRGTEGRKIKFFPHRLASDENCFQYASIRDWNNLPMQ